MKKVAIIFGTRPEAIKMAPLIKVLQKTPSIRPVVIVSGQHREMLDQVLNIFSIRPDYDLDIMRPKQTLSLITTRFLNKVSPILLQEKPDLILVHGDTPTAFVSALAGFYHRIPVGHVEAGLRTHRKYDPFPEEMNRRLIDVLSDLYFAPTKQGQKNLLKEGVEKKKIFITGNTVIDALLKTSQKSYPFQNKQLAEINFQKGKFILLTAHRRESWGQPLSNIFEAVLRVVKHYREARVVFPLHLNPKVFRPARQILGSHKRIYLVDPLDYRDMIHLMKKCYLVMTDSGGLQEEAPALGKPVLVLRQTTERQEGIESGVLRLVGVRSENIFQATCQLLDNQTEYLKMAKAINPYGDGQASQRIKAIILNYFSL